MDLSRYMVVSGLPSNYRSYPELETVRVRGLNFGEVMTLASFLDGEASMDQLATSYSEVIKLTKSNGEDFPLTSLELADFHYLLIVSSILTEDGLSWNARNTCTKCGKSENHAIEVDDIQYKHKVENLSIPVPFNGWSIKPLTVKDKIKLEAVDRLYLAYNKQENSESIDLKSFTTILSYAVMCDYDSEEKLFEFISLINRNPKYYKLIKDLADEMTIYLLPVNLKCSECGHNDQVSYTFEDIRGYL